MEQLPLLLTTFFQVGDPGELRDCIDWPGDLAPAELGQFRLIGGNDERCDGYTLSK